MRAVVIVLLLIFQSIFSQTTPYFYALNKASELPSDLVYDVFQDHKSFIWLATGKGLARFDGLQIKTYHSQKYPTTAVSNINEDIYGRIWSQNFSGDIYYIKNQEKIKFKGYKANGFLRYGLTKQKLFIASRNAVHIFDVKDLKLTQEIKLDLSSVTHTVMVDNLFYLIGDDVVSIDQKGNVTTVISHFKNQLTGPIPIPEGKNLFLFSKFSNNYIKIEGNKFVKKTLPFDTSFTQNANVIDGEIWICTTMGLYRYNPKSNNYNIYFPDLNISYIIKTKENKYWISTINDGALFVDDFDSNFIKTPAKPIKVKRFQNEIFFSTDTDEIFKMNGKTTFESVYKGNSDHIISPFVLDSINHQILVASSKFNIKSAKQNLSSILAVKSIQQLDHKYFLIAASSWNGVVYTNPKTESRFDDIFKNLPTKNENGMYFKSIITGENGKDVVYNPKDGSIYIITNLGIKKFKNDLVTNINVKNSELSFTQFALLNDNLYVLANDEHLYRLENNVPQFVKLPSLISNEGIQKIKVNNGCLFIFKNQYLYCYNPDKNKITKTLNIPNSLEIHDITSMKDYLYLSCTQGLIKIPFKEAETTQPIRLYINDILVNGKKMSESELLKLKSKDNNIEINFDVVSESPNNKYHIEFRLNNRDWETMENNNRVLRFSSLTDGDYNIQIRISNGTQIIHKNIQLSIAPPIHKTWWFITLAIMALLALASAIFRWLLERNNREHQIKLEQANLEKLVNQSKLKSIKSQMNPHFFYNALNTLQSYILANEKREAVNYLSKFSKLTRSILDMSEKEYISLPEEISTLSNYLDLEKARFDNEFEYKLEIDDSINSPEIQIPTLLLQPFIENALKHGLLHKKGDKKLVISFKDKTEYIETTIDDNGIGRKLSQELNAARQPQHNSFATQALYERIELLNQNNANKIKLQYIDKPNAKGTTVILWLPKNTNTI